LSRAAKPSNNLNYQTIILYGEIFAIQKLRFYNKYFHINKNLIFENWKLEFQLLYEKTDFA